jgi:putative colanic acid biosynthesis UDP-glucose lipid carrier transferase
MVDFSLALILILLLTPVLLTIACAIKCSSPGPVLFRQQRYGSRQRSFSIIKFRSMWFAGCCDGEVKQAQPQDPRVTALGRVLRRTSLDELPQLFNVLRGEMSLIGPRPHAVSHDNYFMNRIPRYARRFSVRPGITGLAQVSGARGETRTDADMKRRVDLDIYYIENASFVLDMKILLATIHEVMSSKDAY